MSAKNDEPEKTKTSPLKNLLQEPWVLTLIAYILYLTLPVILFSFDHEQIRDVHWSILRICIAWTIVLMWPASLILCLISLRVCLRRFIDRENLGYPLATTALLNILLLFMFALPIFWYLSFGYF